MSKPDMMAHLRALPLGLRGMGIGDPDEGGRIEAAEVVQWAVGEIERLRITDAEREALETAARIAGAVGESEVKATLRAFLERHAKGGGCE